MNRLARLVAMSQESDDLSAVTELFQMANAKLYLAFHALQQGKRVLNRICSGVVMFGAVAPPVETYVGSTARKSIKCTEGTLPSANGAKQYLPAPTVDEEEEDCKSLGNVSRGDWI